MTAAVRPWSVALRTLILLALLLTACQAAAPAAPTAQPSPVQRTTVRVAGAGGTLSVLRLLADEYGRQHQDLAFDFLSGAGQSGGIKGAQEGQFDLVAMGRTLKDDEVSTGFVYLGFGVDRVVVGVTPDVTVKGLTTAQLEDILLGAITRWSDVGGADAPISVLVRDEEDSNTSQLRKALIGDAPFVASAVLITSGNDMQAALMRQTNSLGYLTYSGIRLEKLPIAMLALDGADPADPRSGYPYTRPLGLAYLPAGQPRVQPFVDFVQGPQAQALLASYGLSEGQ